MRSRGLTRQLWEVRAAVNCVQKSGGGEWEIIGFVFFLAFVLETVDPRNQPGNQGNCHDDNPKFCADSLMVHVAE